MAYLIGPPCVGVKDASCVDVCPVDCIHPAPGEEGWESAEQLFIDPEECIDCDACMEACPVEAVAPVHTVPAGWEGAEQRNAAFFAA